MILPRSIDETRSIPSAMTGLLSRTGIVTFHNDRTSTGNVEAVDPLRVSPPRYVGQAVGLLQRLGG